MDRTEITTLLANIDDETISDETFTEVRDAMRGLEPSEAYELLKELAANDEKLSQKLSTMDLMLKLSEDSDFYSWIADYVRTESPEPVSEPDADSDEE